MTKNDLAEMEETVSRLTGELHAEVEHLCKNLQADDPDVKKLRSAVANLSKNLEAARGAGIDYALADKMRGRKLEPIYSWELLPVYAWNNEFARCIGHMLATLSKRHHIFLHNLAGQATVISHCIAAAFRDVAPGDFVRPEEVQAYLRIALHATLTVEQILDDLSETTSHTAPYVAQSRELMSKIRHQFEIDRGEVVEEKPQLVH